MSEMVEKAWEWLIELVRKSAPISVCMLGMTAPITLSPGNIWIGILIAAFSFTWALDMAATRAAAKAKEETAGRFIKALTSGEDTLITVEIFRRDAALSEVGR